jgi:uncharacterized MAPEG superfamily protein
MTIELDMLALSVVLGFVHIALQGLTATSQYGVAWNAGPRDEAMPPLNSMAGRMRRALANFFETFPLFAAAVLIAHVAGKDSQATMWGAQLYFWGRVVYVPLYAFGVPFVRTLVWIVATIGIVMILVALV